MALPDTIGSVPGFQKTAYNNVGAYGRVHYHTGGQLLHGAFGALSLLVASLAYFNASGIHENLQEISHSEFGLDQAAFPAEAVIGAIVGFSIFRNFYEIGLRGWTYNPKEYVHIINTRWGGNI